ncbi:MAG: XdhC family protein [Acidiferrobacter sp.]
MDSDGVWDKAAQMKAAGIPFAWVTVVRCESPTSAKPGARGLVTADGPIEGWVGGGCVQPTVLAVAREALRDGQPRLIRVAPAGDVTPPAGMLLFPMHCYSGGVLDLFIEPMMVRPVLWVVGGSPVAEALWVQGRALGFQVTAFFPGQRPTCTAERVVETLNAETLAGASTAFVVVATQGDHDEEGLEAALAISAPYIALVASARKAQQLKEFLRVQGHDAARVDAIIAPAGIDIGATTAAEIALAVLAQVVQIRRSAPASIAADAVSNEPLAPLREDAASLPVDPVCGMQVAPEAKTPQSVYQGRHYYFCCAHCRQAFEQTPARYAEAS